MNVYYYEFQATRRADRGWEMKECAGQHRLETSDKIKNAVHSMMNSFAYDSYAKPGYFLFYNEVLKKFVCARGSSGEVVDKRINMTITVRVPEVIEGDGFGECVQFIRMWENIEKINHTVSQICNAYGIEKTWLEDFSHTLYELVFSGVVKPVQVKTRPENGRAREMEFVTDMMELCYMLVPASKVFRLSLGFGISEEKLGGTRLLFSGDTTSLHKVYDISTKSSLLAGVVNKMICRIVEEAWNYRDGEYFQNKIDQYRIPLVDYDSLYWNYWYYLLDNKEEISCSLEEFKRIKERLRKFIQNNQEGADALYDHIVRALRGQNLKREENAILMVDYLKKSAQKKVNTEEQLELLWDLILAYTERKQEVNEEIISEIGDKYHVMYYPMLKKGLAYGYVSFQYFVEKENINSTQNIEMWLKKEESEGFLEDDTVKHFLMGILENDFRQDAPIEKLQQLIVLGCKIDKAGCFEICKKYLSSGLENVSEKNSIAAYQAFFEKTEWLWFNNSLRKTMEEIALKLAQSFEMPISLKETEAFIKLPQSLGNTNLIQKTLIEKCNMYLQNTDTKHDDVKKCLELLIHWDTKVLETEQKTFFEDLLCGRQAREDLHVMLETLCVADTYLQKDHMISLMELFWQQFEIKQLDALYEENWFFQNQPQKFSVLKYPLHNNKKQRIFQLYYELYEENSLKVFLESVEDCLRILKPEETEQMLDVFLLEWKLADAQSFKRIYEMQMRYWGDVDVILKRIEKTIKDEKEKRSLIRRVQTYKFVKNSVMGRFF